MTHLDFPPSSDRVSGSDPITIPQDQAQHACDAAAGTLFSPICGWFDLLTHEVADAGVMCVLSNRSELYHGRAFSCEVSASPEMSLSIGSTMLRLEPGSLSMPGAVVVRRVSCGGGPDSSPVSSRPIILFPMEDADKATRRVLSLMADDETGTAHGGDVRLLEDGCYRDLSTKLLRWATLMYAGVIGAGEVLRYYPVSDDADRLFQSCLSGPMFERAGSPDEAHFIFDLVSRSGRTLELFERVAGRTKPFICVHNTAATLAGSYALMGQIPDTAGPWLDFTPLIGGHQDPMPLAMQVRGASPLVDLEWMLELSSLSAFHAGGGPAGKPPEVRPVQRMVQALPMMGPQAAVAAGQSRAG